MGICLDDTEISARLDPQPYTILTTELASTVNTVPTSAGSSGLSNCRKTFNISRITISEYEPSTHHEVSDNYTATLPTSWSVSELFPQTGHNLLFSYAVTLTKKGITVPITQKSVTLDTERKLCYYIYGHLVNVDGTDLDKILDNTTMLPSILIKFQHMNVCSGIGDVSVHFIQADSAFKNYIDQWHHHECSLLSKRKRCDRCIKLRKNILQKELRLKNPSSINRICGLSNPLDEKKLQAIRIKMNRERREKNRAKFRSTLLKESLKAKEDEIANIKDLTLDTRCSELNVPAAQKTAMKEIIAAASKKDAKGRRYTEEWIMLCVLMNIRSPGYYDFFAEKPHYAAAMYTDYSQLFFRHQHEMWV
ncbi:unnamed protein product [Lasius platythorax]|uniref:Uncharacterized protein n=1 Tax=Lasius platythorax TaxID=488582 RepID=A0AAV2NLE3_9HYME